MPEPRSTVHLDLDSTRRLAMACLHRAGCDTPNACAVADTVTAAERDGCPAHGLFRIPGYCVALRAGRANGRAVPRLTGAAGAVLRMNADAGFAPRALGVGYEPLERSARHHGIAALAISNTLHFAALWPEVETLALRGLVAFAFTGSRAFVAPAGGHAPVLGTNPMAFAWPRPDRPPMVFDQASSTMARGEVMIAAREGNPVPEGVGLDPAGKSSTDPAAILAGAQLAFGGYKGASIALMVELLAGPLIGECLAVEAGDGVADEGPARGGELVLALDPGHFADAPGYQAHAEILFQHIGRQPGTRLPGERRARHRAVTMGRGIHIPRALHERLQELA